MNRQPSFVKHATNATKRKSAEEELLQTVEEYANDLRETLESSGECYVEPDESA